MEAFKAYTCTITSVIKVVELKSELMRLNFCSPCSYRSIGPWPTCSRVVSCRHFSVSEMPLSHFNLLFISISFVIRGRERERQCFFERRTRSHAERQTAGQGEREPNIIENICMRRREQTKEGKRGTLLLDYCDNKYEHFGSKLLVEKLNSQL